VSRLTLCSSPLRQARRRRAGLAVVGVSLLAALPVLWLGGCSRDAAADSDDAGAAGSTPPSVLVQTLPLQQGSLPRNVTAYGVVQAAPNAQNSIVAPVAAQVGQVYVRSGQAVHAGAPLVQLLPSPPTQANYAQAVSALKVATEGTAHTRALLAQFLATAQQLADAEKAESDARAALEALRAQGAGGPHTLRAPFNAIVTNVTATARALVSEGSPLVDIARSDGLVLMVGVPPDAASSISAGNPVSVTPVGESRSYPAKVIERGAIVQTDSGLVPVQISLPERGFMPGESAQASIRVGSVAGIVVPHEAVLIDDNGNSYVVQAIGDTARIVNVQVLDSEGAREVISGPLDTHAPLVLTGNYQAQDGMKLRFATPGGGGAAAGATGAPAPTTDSSKSAAAH
jgi:membrane fusion protein, multidrug efflux system